MSQPTTNFFNWLLLFSVEAFKLSPVASATLILIRLFAQISAILAFLLPLKIIILLGSESMPRYLPSGIENVDRDLLIIALSIASVTFFILNLIAEQNLSALTEKVASKLLSSKQSDGHIEDQSKPVRTAYYWFSVTSTAIVFILLAFTTLGLIYPEVAIFSAIFFLLLILMLAFTWNKIIALEPKVFISRLKIACSAGFLLTFVFMVGHLMLTMKVSLIVAIVTLLVMRQLFKYFVQLIGGFLRLHNISEKLLFFVYGDKRRESSSLSFSATAYKKPKQKKILYLQELNDQKNWLSSIISEHQLKLPDSRDLTWYDSGTPDVSILKISSNSVSYVLVIYGERRTAVSSRELSLVSATCMQKHLPSPEFLGFSKVNSLTFHIFQLNTDSHIVEKPSRLDRNMSFLIQMMSVSPPDKFIDEYHQTRLFFWEKLQPESIDELKTFTTDSKSLRLVEDFNQILQQIKDILKKLPLILDNSFAETACYIESCSGEISSFRWEQWRLEPVGANLSPDTSDETIKNMISSIKHTRPEFSKVTVNQVRLCINMAEFERSLRKHRHIACLNMLSKLMETVSSTKNQLSDYSEGNT